jgi:hypothetical protein
MNAKPKYSTTDDYKRGFLLIFQKNWFRKHFARSKMHRTGLSAVHKFPKNLEATSEFQAPVWQQEASSMLDTHKR